MIGAVPHLHTRNRESFEYAREIVKPHGGLDPIIDWCKVECQSDWRWQLIDVSTDTRPGKYAFFFDSDRDCAAFCLKWC